MEPMIEVVEHVFDDAREQIVAIGEVIRDRARGIARVLCDLADRCGDAALARNHFARGLQQLGDFRVAVTDGTLAETKRDAFRKDGAVLMEGVLAAEDLKRCRAALDWGMTHPGPSATGLFDGTEHRTHNDNANPNLLER